jgi:hypothetical protein
MQSVVAGADVRGGILRGFGDAELGLLLEHAVGGDLDVVVVLQGLGDEGLEGWVGEDVLVLLGAERCGVRGGGCDVGRKGAAVVGGCGNGGALVVGAYFAAGEHESEE